MLALFLLQNKFVYEYKVIILIDESNCFYIKNNRENIDRYIIPEVVDICSISEYLFIHVIYQSYIKGICASEIFLFYITT